MMVDPTPRFSQADAVDFAREFYGLTATASPLPSERDQNFALTTEQGEKFVLKIAKADESRDILDFQNAALRHIATHEPGLAVSLVCPTTSGSAITSVRDSTGRTFFVRLVSWLDGDLLVKVSPHDEALLISLGTALARLDAAFATFNHPAMHRTLHWDLRHIGLALEHLPLLSPNQQRIVQHFRAQWEKVDWSGLRTSVIHGDGNDYNVLVRNGEVAGFLDFGDMVNSAVVCDLAIVLAYVMLEKADPIEVARTVAGAYHRRLPLQREEIDALFALTTSRLCMSVCYAAHNARAKSDDAYQLVTATPAWALLGRLVELSPDVVSEQLRAACAPPGPEVA